MAGGFYIYSFDPNVMIMTANAGNHAIMSPIASLSDYPREREREGGWKRAYLIFVTGITDSTCGQKSAMCRNFGFHYKTDVEIVQISPHNIIFPHLSWGEIEMK